MGLDHPTDLALKVWGEEFFVLLAQSVLGMYDLMGVVMDDKVRIDHNFLVEISTPGTELVDFLGELLYQAVDLKIAYSGFIFSMTEEQLKIQADGHPIKEMKRSLKAVTYHDLEIIETDAGLEAIITFKI